MKIFSDRRLPKCYSRAEWEDFSTSGTSPVLKLSFDIINQSDDPLEIVRFDVSHPSGVMIVEDHTQLARFIYSAKSVRERPALTDHFVIDEELDGKVVKAQDPAERCFELGRREYTFYCLPEDENSPIFEMKRKRLFERNMVVFTLSYRHADEAGRVRKLQVAATVPDWVKLAA
ncbi:hypothetical protein [Acetobacter phage phiAX1]|nr:hypothetical protein [Acetobacter phage phiAX1]